MSDAAFPDGTVWVRTEPVTFLHDHERAPHAHAWHQVTYALAGLLEVESADARALVPPDRAVWVPAGVVHRETMRAPVTVRTLYLAPGAYGPTGARPRTIAISPLLRELVAHVSPLGSLDREDPVQAHLADVLVDLLRAAPDTALTLPLPHDPRARKLATLVQSDPAAPTPMAELARRAGGSLRTIERCFVRETGMRVGEWRRRLRLLHAVRLLERGLAVAEVAERVGYASPSAFSAAFGRLFGAAPSVRMRGRP